MTIKASAWDECFHCPHMIALHLGPAINWVRQCLVPSCDCPGFPIAEMPDEMFGDPRERPSATNKQDYQDWAADPINHPQHYTSHPSGIECIQITEHMNFCLGNAVKYIWRADLKHGTEDLRKAQWYLQREISRREADATRGEPVAPTGSDS